jgi:FixJ family two-component response regulator
MNELKPIVFIDNDVLPVRRSTERLIQSAGLKVQTFTSAKEFLKNARFEGPACLVLDVRMPGLSGMDLWTKICLTFPVLSDQSQLCPTPNPAE